MSFEFSVVGTFADMGFSGAQNTLKGAMDKGVQNMVRQAKINASGRPGPNVDTGRFRASINGTVSGSGSELVGIIGSNVDYAPVLEFGFSGSVTVKAFVRSAPMAAGMHGPGAPVRVRSHARKFNRKALPSLGPAVESPFMVAAFAAILTQEISKYMASGAK